MDDLGVATCVEQDRLSHEYTSPKLVSDIQEVPR